MHTDYLEHHGILGQKWGVRRFQNSDGTLTDAGKKRIKSNEKYRNKQLDFLKEHKDWDDRAAYTADRLKVYNDEEFEWISKAQKGFENESKLVDSYIKKLESININLNSKKDIKNLMSEMWFKEGENKFAEEMATFADVAASAVVGKNDPEYLNSKSSK